MNELFNYLLEASLLLALLYGVYWGLLRTESSHQFNRYFLLGSMVLASIIPLLGFSLTIPSVNMPLAAYYLPEFTINAAGETIKWWISIDVYTSILIFYLTGVSIFSLRFVYRTYQLRSLLKKSTWEYVQHGGYYLVETKGTFPTSSFLNYLFWDETVSLSEAETEKIKQHELVHIHEQHSLDLILAELLKCILWFNPFIYLIKKQLAMVHEYLADRKVLDHCQPAEYQQLMLKQLFQVNPLAFSNPFNQSQILKRMKMMQSHKNIKPWKIALAVLATGSILVLNACELESVVAQKKTVKVEGAIYQIVEKPATYIGGQDAFIDFLSENIQYPNAAQEDQIEGTVHVQFIITKDGQVAEAQIKKGVNEDLDQEALRVVNLMPDWNPGSQEGKAVNTMLIVPIRFSLGSS